MIFIKVLKLLLLLGFTLKLNTLSNFNFGCEGVSLSEDGSDEFLKLDKNTKSFPPFVKGYEDSSSKTSIDLHPSLWSSEYYEVLNPKSLPAKGEITQKLNGNSSMYQNNKTLHTPDFIRSVKLGQLDSKHKSSYITERENESEHEQGAHFVHDHSISCTSSMSKLISSKPR